MPDPHFHYHHPDTVAFLRAIKRKFTPTHVIAAGDLKDHHADSYHEHDPDLPSSGDEHRASNLAIRPLFRLFPQMDVLESNHGALPNRKAKTAGLSKEFLRPEKERIGAPAGWTWHKQLIVDTPRGAVLFIHGNRASANLFLFSLKKGVSIMQGHFHSKFEVLWWNNGTKQCFAATSGCLIWDPSPAFEYNKDDVLRPILGVTMLLDGAPFLLPMRLNSKRRWTGEI